MERIVIVFVCTGNSCRSQMAEGFARVYGGSLVDAYSAGTNPAERINPDAITVMKEKGIDLTGQYPKLLKDVPSEPDILISMGCGAACPYIPSFYREDWGIEDPAGSSLEKFREARGLIEHKILELIAALKDVKNLDELNGIFKKSKNREK